MLIPRRFEWVVASNFCSRGMDAKGNSPRRMEFDELSNRVTGNWAQDCWSRPMSSAFALFVLFVSFVVKQSCTFARGTLFRTVSSVAQQGTGLGRE